MILLVLIIIPCIENRKEGMFWHFPCRCHSSNGGSPDWWGEIFQRYGEYGFLKIESTWNIYIVLTSFHPQMMIFVIIGLLTGLTMVAGETVKNFHRLIFQNWQHFVAILTTNPNGEVHIGSDIISTCWLTFILVHVDSRDLKTFASSFICTNKLSEYFQMFQIFKNISKHSNTFRSIPKYFPIFQNIPKYPQIFPNISK